MEMLNLYFLCLPKKWVIVIATQLIWPILAIVGRAFEGANWTPNSSFHNFLGRGRHMLFLSSNWNFNATSEVDHIYTAPNILVALFAALSIFASSFHFIAALNALAVSAFTIWSATTNFLEILTDNNVDGNGTNNKILITIQMPALKQIHEKYCELADLAQKINGVWSGLCLWLILDTCGWVTFGLDKTLQTASYVYIVYCFSMLAYLVVVLVLSAESARKVKNIYIPELLQLIIAFMNTENEIFHINSCQNRWFLSYMMNRDFTGLNGNENFVEAFIQRIQNTAICVGEANFFQVDYTFVCQVSNKFMHDA